MKTLLGHKGYSGSSEISHEDDCLHGQILFIEDLITYEAQTPSALAVSFQEAVDRYLEHCANTGIPANKPCTNVLPA